MLLAESLLAHRLIHQDNSSFTSLLPIVMACNMTLLKFVLTSTPEGLSSVLRTHIHPHTPLLMGQAEPLMLKRLQLSISKLGWEGGSPPLGVITALSHIPFFIQRFRSLSLCLSPHLLIIITAFISG